MKLSIRYMLDQWYCPKLSTSSHLKTLVLVSVVSGYLDVANKVDSLQHFFLLGTVKYYLTCDLTPYLQNYSLTSIQLLGFLIYKSSRLVTVCFFYSCMSGCIM